MIKYKISHIPQVPGKPFTTIVGNFNFAIRIGMILADYDRFQFEENIKPDYSNVTLIEVSADGEHWEPCDEEVIADRQRLLSRGTPR